MSNMKIGIDYHERCTCGSEFAIKDALRETLEKRIDDWRKNHICPYRKNLTLKKLK